MLRKILAALLVLIVGVAWALAEEMELKVEVQNHNGEEVTVDVNGVTEVISLSDLAEGEERTYTYNRLYREVNRFANALKRLGVGLGDRVILYMPLVPEGIVGRVPYRGSLSSNVHQLVGGLKAGMGYLGAVNLSELRKRARYIRVSGAGMREASPHDVVELKTGAN